MIHLLITASLQWLTCL